MILGRINVKKKKEAGEETNSSCGRTTILNVILNGLNVRRVVYSFIKKMVIVAYSRLIPVMTRTAVQLFHEPKKQLQVH